LRACVFGASGGIGEVLTRQLAASDPAATIYAGSRSPRVRARMNIRPFQFDLADEPSIVAAARQIELGGPLDLAIVATGLLHEAALAPEKTWQTLDPAAMAQSFAINAIGPALIAKHILPLLNKERRSVFAVLSARVGSISDNRVGGWHSYRASKAALNMLVRNFAIELRRRNPHAIAVALHPGTVDTALSRPFQANLPDGQLTSAEFSAARLLDVIARLGSDDSGAHLAWDGAHIPA
jgi:NAD(P)-dependent dehydrogenase (short-subunit alcohol dehydrogenase family)